MTLDDIITAAYTLKEGDADTPSSSDDEYTIATRYANAAVNMWENEEGMMWNELWVSLADASDGDKTTTDGTLSYYCPTDFNRPGGYVRLDTGTQSTYYSIIPSHKAQIYDNDDKRVCWFSGNPNTGYDLNFLDDPDGAYTISYEYYKNASSLSATTDVPELSDPYFIVWFIIWRLYKDDGLIEQANEAKDITLGKLSQMKTKNLQNTWFQDNRVEDRLLDQGVGGFGQ